MIYPNFSMAIRAAYQDMRLAPLIHPKTWQGLDMSKKPDAQTYELLNYNLSIAIAHKTLEELRADIKPNLPWADDHFKERVGGLPINPGIQWAKWPWGNSADKFRDANGQFNHNYMERYWPKRAGLPEPKESYDIHKGIRYAYGDLDDVVNQLADDPTTRQAYLPVFFPEDTGAVHKGRVPCSLGYHFIQRGGYLHINYYLRSCEAHRHFKDDIYLTVRLLLWVTDRLKERGHNFTPGIFSMYMTSFHCFINDRPNLSHE